MISHPFITGLLVGFSLIIAFGAQNIFVLNHGLMRLYVFPIVLFCSLADFTLIGLGIAGIDYFEDSLELYKAEILAFAASWLFLYAIFKLKSAVAGDILAVHRRHCNKVSQAPVGVESILRARSM